MLSAVSCELRISEEKVGSDGWKVNAVHAESTPAGNMTFGHGSVCTAMAELVHTIISLLGSLAYHCALIIREVYGQEAGCMLAFATDLSRSLRAVDRLWSAGGYGDEAAAARVLLRSWARLAVYLSQSTASSIRSQRTTFQSGNRRCRILVPILQRAQHAAAKPVIKL